MNWILSKLFGTNWKANLTYAFKVAADEQLATNTSLTESAVATWAEAQVTSISTSIAKGNPLEAALLMGAADSFLPDIVKSLYSSLIAKAGLTAPAASPAQATAA